MAKQQRLTLKRPAPRAEGPAPGGGELAAPDPNRVPVIIIVLFALHMLAMFSILLLMTPYTNNLDDIKQSVFHGGWQVEPFRFLGFPSAPLLMVVALVAVLLRAAPLPTKWVGRGLAGYWGVMIVSTLWMSTSGRGEIAAHIRWMGWDQVIMIWGGLGLFMSALAINAHARSAQWFLRFLTVQWLAVNLVGFMMFDLLGEGQHRSVVGWLFRQMFETQGSFWAGVLSSFGEEGRQAVYALLLTLNNADTQMQSTILNRDFYAGLSLLYLPIALLLALDPGQGRHALPWRVLGGATAFLTLVSLFLCQSKGEYIFVVVMLAYFLAMFIKFGYAEGLRRRHLVVSVASGLLVFGVMVFLRSPVLLQNLKSLNTSVSSRSIMWTGAWEMFKDFPLLGGGPGSYRVYFSTYRAPDYFLHEIANVTTYSHNYFLDLLSETGLAGLAVYLVFLGALWLGGLRHAVRHVDGRIRMLMIALTAALLGYYGSNLSSPNARWIIGATNLYTVLGMLAGGLRRAEGWRPAAPEDELAAGTGSPRPWVRYAVVGGLVLSLPMLFISRQAGQSYWQSSVTYAEGLQYMETGMARIGEGKIDEAKEFLVGAAERFEKAIAIDPNNVSAYYKIGSIYSTLDRVYESDAQMARRQSGANAEQLQVVADKYCELALQRYQRLDQLMPDYAEIHFNFGIVYDRMAQVLKRRAATLPEAQRETVLARVADYDQKSRDHLERMHKLSVKNEVYQMLGSQYQLTGLHEKALETYREAVARYPEDKELLRKYHDAALMSQTPAEMFKALRLLWRQDNLDNEYVSRMINVAVENKLAVELATLANELLKINPLDPRVYYARMVLAKWTGRKPDVVTEAERYCKAGGRQVAVLQLGAKTAAELGLNDKVAALQACIQSTTGTTPADKDALPVG